ncbi:MAG: hypothetical protein P0Y65_14725 [Candidatus Devosia phytovorans]|uniref:Uncharacterized protein n=1 Tax=Candidatus Devosia phytovorans TaxID=3121372 RepID=A0AAJ6AYY5_9HYPH|nr:hypothetical protein [Devosia sp.]WEK03442.1 MAG: hypothetical protein P0Y65_14725 [Devosia sp.]
MWRGIIVHGIPLIIAIGAALLLLPSIMGASAMQGVAASQGYNVGIAALFLYPASYQALIIAWGICRWRGWSLQRIFLQLIWLCLLLFAGAMSYSLVTLQTYLQNVAS